MKALILLLTFVCFSVHADEVFRIEYMKGTSKSEEYFLTPKKSRQFELTKITPKQTKKATLKFKEGNRLSEIVTKLAFSEKTNAPCTAYLVYSVDGQKGKVCQEELKRTSKAMRLMHQLNSLVSSKN